MKGVVALAVMLMATAGPVFAEPWIDYELLRQIHADKVVTETDSEGNETWRLDMGDGVTVSCSEGGCVGMDMEDGAVGCSFALIADVKARVAACASPISSERSRLLDALYVRIGKFVAANTVPRLEWTELEGYADGLGQNYREQLKNKGPTICAPVADVMMDDMAWLTNPEMKQELDSLLLRPRLPVINPCM